MKKISLIIFFFMIGCASVPTYTLYQSPNINADAYKKIYVGSFIEGQDVENPLASQYLTGILLKELKEKSNIQIIQFNDFFEQFKKETPDYEQLAQKEKGERMFDWQLKHYDLIIIPVVRVYKTIHAPGPSTIYVPNFDRTQRGGFFGGLAAGLGSVITVMPHDAAVIAIEIAMLNKNKEVVWHFYDYRKGGALKQLGTKIIQDAVENMPFK